MITKDYIAEFKELRTYDIIKKGFDNNQVECMLLGEGTYAMSWLPISSTTDPSAVIIGLHILTSENIVLNNKINEAFNNIDINANNVCLLLDYIRTYLNYCKDESVLIFDYKKVLEKINRKEENFKNMICYKNFKRQIDSILE